ncbi:hypothetical protein [Solimonas soli]|uniref:hypothetical protein n=1 Tax=Solimonas soli TaxID=413479 RepID=UPI0004840201|nr:hypothetical protein [Solimonas soli]
MLRFRTLLARAGGLALLLAALPSQALLEDQNHFVLDKSGGACVLRLDPQRDALNVSFTGPNTLVLESSYEFIGGSGIKLSFDDGTEVHLSGSSNSSRKIIAAIPPEKMAGFSSNKRVKIGGESSRGPLYRRIRLQDFAAGYSELAGCAAK